MEVDLEELRAAVELVRSDLTALERQFPVWDAGSTSGGRKLRLIAKRVVGSSQRLQDLVKQNTYSPQ